VDNFIRLGILVQKNPTNKEVREIYKKCSGEALTYIKLSSDELVSLDGTIVDPGLNAIYGAACDEAAKYLY